MALCSVGASPRALTHSRAHQHPFFEVVLNLEGEGITDIGGERSAFFPGSVHIVPPYTPHTKETQATFQDIYFHTDTIPFPLPGPVSFRDDGAGTLRQLMQMMLSRYLQCRQNDAVLERMYCLVMDMIEEKHVAAPIDPLVDAVMQQLALSFNDPELSVGAVLEQTGYQKDYIRRRFAAVVGMSPSAYLTHLRMEQAKKLLVKRKESGLSIADVGELCGYYDARYFSRVFKKSTGVIPAAYRYHDRHSTIKEKE